MQVIIEDYVHHEPLKLILVVGNSFFAIIVGLTSVYGLLKLSFGL
jgi:succinate dehydrogenase / fumarate reductase, membrane anchor subunit